MGRVKNVPREPQVKRRRSTHYGKSTNTGKKPPVARTQSPSKSRQVLAQRATDYWNRYHELGNIRDLKTAIKLDRECLQALGGEDDGQGEVMGNLGLSLLDLFRKTGNPDDLEEALGYLERALTLMKTCPLQSLSRAKINYANALCARATLSGDRSDLDNGILLLEEAIDETQVDHPAWDRHLRLSLLARALVERGDPSDLARAMQLMAGKSTSVSATETLPISNPTNEGMSLNLRGFGQGARGMQHCSIKTLSR